MRGVRGAVCERIVQREVLKGCVKCVVRCMIGGGV